VEAAGDVASDLLTLLYDPQTAGGLLIAVADADAQRLLTALQDAAVDAVEIGDVIPRQKPLIAVRA
jgi:selenide,water dikinase